MIYQTKTYFNQMDYSVSDKVSLSKYIKGKKVLDAGCGSGKLMDSLESIGFTAYGIDLSSGLFNPSLMSNKRFKQGDLSEIKKHFINEGIETVIFSSVLHEVYSYGGYDLKKVENVITQAYEIIPVGGRIIIRDGVMPEGEFPKVIHFKDSSGPHFLKNFIDDFKARKIKAKKIGANLFLLSPSDAMEFLYTYTWGLPSYEREVKEQYGLMTLRQYEKWLTSILPASKIYESSSYLQEGYSSNLSTKVSYFNMSFKEQRLPDSNMILVIEKGE